MKLIEVSPSPLSLQGITLSSSFIIRNPHQTLSVMFQIECRPINFLQIEPERGMIMAGDQKYIMVRIKKQKRAQATKYQKQNNFIQINATYYCEYNKKLMSNLHIGGWSQIAQSYATTELPIFISNDYHQLKSTLKRGGSLSNSQKSMNSFENFRKSSEAKKKIKDPKLKEDLDFIFRNQEVKKNKYGSEINSRLSQIKLNEQKMNENLRKNMKVSSNIVSTENKLKSSSVLPTSNALLPNNFNDIRNITPQTSPFKLNFNSNGELNTPMNSYPVGNSNQINEQMSSNRAFELIILAVIAALCAGIGEWVGRR